MKPHRMRRFRHQLEQIPAESAIGWLLFFLLYGLVIAEAVWLVR